MDATQKPLLIPPDFAVYAERHGLFQLYERMMQELIVSQPEDPLEAMLAILKRPSDDVPTIVIHGPPAAGKRTMCKLVSQRLRCVHVVPDELLRDEDSLIAQEAQSQLLKGKVQDRTWAELIKERVMKSDCLTKVTAKSGDDVLLNVVIDNY
ncbi:adenylate kinase 8-like [Corticium candelabrum]|uniref:adenylate kinase 8-like n=1 Tax=Corticium candelabrum TaxID=121492 RepID=UPI002E27321C|nr:adenylate kinase 8-like [Corticium candelabrum]